MNTGYTPEQGLGFVRPGETKKPCYRVFSGIKKAAPIRNRLSEQLTCCEKNGSVQGNYINRVVKRHYCRITSKTKATAKGSPVGTRENKSITNNATFAAGGQCNQSGSVRCHTCNERFSLYSLRNCSRAKAHGANLSDSCSIFLRRLFRVGDNVLVNSLSVIVLSCIAMRRNTLHHGAGDGYSCSLAFRRWRRLISPSSAETINCPVLSPSSFKFSTASAIAWGTRASSFLDFPLTAFVAISDFLVIRWLTVYTQENRKTLLTWLTPVTSIVADTFIKVIDEKTKPAGATNTNGLLTTNDSRSIEAAMRNYTRHPQGRDSYNLNKYIWRFIALSTAQPRVITIEATSEQEARQQSPDGCVMVFAARIRQGETYAQ
ncbi:TPA: host cell division inhibitor Icd-like protein [Escherichia coli]|nr:host cell division inhibitor Icd-like protein [Escherichia coli]HCW2840059.1 host cell division inhibitor Icd-like protein [Escherichia coli]HCW2995310.1 host cell division inhibitor Icd-like protein [Escherichia coli]HDL0299829.1 host cell division inhibitor Icd-like protein [Escherichia coli]